MYSLSRTLTVRFALTMAVTLSLIAVWAYSGTHRILLSQLDRGIRTAYYLEAASLASGPALPLLGAGENHGRFVADVNRFVVARTRDGVIRASNAPEARALPGDTLALRRALAGQETWRTVSWHGDRLRELFAPVPPTDGSDTLVLQVAASLHPMERASRQVLWLMLGTALLGTVATAFGANWLARSAVQPLFEITAQANAIQPETTGRRITAHSDAVEYRGLVEVLNGMLERLDRAFATQRRIITDVGHDLRTPLTAMRGEIEVALRAARQPAQYETILASLLEETERLQSISEALILLARVESGTLAPEREMSDVAALAADVVRSVDGRSPDHAFAVEPADGMWVEADPRMLRVVLEQLLDNVVRHTPPGTAASVRMSRHDYRIDIEVADTGGGIDPDRLPLLFQHFYRGDAARGRTGGAGLGLTIAAAIVRAHGGSLSAHAVAPHGLAVTFTLPAAAAVPA